MSIVNRRAPPPLTVTVSAMSNATVHAAVPAYFEESWAILSSIDLVNVLLGLMIIGITTLSPLALVPIITSAAGSIANGTSLLAFQCVRGVSWVVTLGDHVFPQGHKLTLAGGYRNVLLCILCQLFDFIYGRCRSSCRYSMAGKHLPSKILDVADGP